MTLRSRFMRSVVCLLGATAAAASPQATTDVIVHQGGRGQHPPASDAARLRTACERLLADADGIPRLIVDAARVRRIMERGTAVEIVYAAPRTERVLGREIAVARLLVPIGGDLPDGLVFYAPPGEPLGGVNMVRNSRGTRDIAELLRGQPRDPQPTKEER